LGTATFDRYTTLWYYSTVVFVESAAFIRRLRALAGVEENNVLRGIQNDLIEAPTRGDLVPGLGGIFYLYLEHRQHIHLLFILDKDEQEDLSTDERTIIRGMVTELKKAGGTR